MVNCNLDKEDQQKFDELMKKFIRKSIGKFRNTDLVRLCIRFTWENFDQIKQLKSEITRLNEIIIKQQKELNEKNNKIEKALQSLQ